MENISETIPTINISHWIVKKDKKVETIKKLLNKLDDSRCADRGKWWAVGMCVKKELNENDGWIVFDEWSKGCEEKYDYDKNRDIWDAMEVKDSMNVNVLKKYVNEDAIKDINENKSKRDKSHAGIAKLFIEEYPNILNTNKTVYIFDKHRWTEISKIKLQKLIASDFVNIIARRLSETVDEDDRDYYVEVIASLSHTKILNDICKYVEVLVNDDDAYEKLDENPNLIGFNNGVYDMKTGEFRDGKPDDYLTYTTNYDYLPSEEEKLDMWNNLLTDIFPDQDVRYYYKQVMAATLCGNRKFEQLYMHTGSGGNGKGLLTDLMQMVFGEYYSVMNSNLLTIASKSRNEASSELANKKGKRLAVTTEIEEGSTLQMAAIKQWSGGDKISTRELYKSAFEFIPQFTLHMYFNDKQPDLKSVDNAIKRRLRMFHYPISFVDNPTEPHHKKINPNLKGALKEDTGLWNAVISDLFEVWKDVSKLDFIQAPKECQKHIDKYLAENDTVNTWFVENIVRKAGSKIKATDLYQKYVEWMGKDPKTLSNTAFGKVMTDRFKVEKKHTRNGNIYENIAFGSGADAEDSDDETEDI